MTEKSLEILGDELQELQTRLAVRTAELDQVEKALRDHQRASRQLVERRLERSVAMERYARILWVSACLFASIVVVITALAVSQASAIGVMGAGGIFGLCAVAQRLWWRHRDPTVQDQPAASVVDLTSYRAARGIEYESSSIALVDLVSRLTSSPMTIETKIEVVTMASEPLLDYNNGDPMLVCAITDALAKEWRSYEKLSRIPETERLRRRVQITALRARAMHCAGDSRRALAECLAAFAAVENSAGGREAVLRELSSPHPNIAAECVVAVVGIMAASLRRAVPEGASVRQHLTVKLRSIVDAYISPMHPDSSVIYPGTASMVQVLYLLAEQGHPSDAGRIEALRRLDDLVRPSDLRAQATRPLREMALALTRTRPQVHDDKGLPRHHDVAADSAAEPLVPSFSNGIWH